MKMPHARTIVALAIVFLIMACVSTPEPGAPPSDLPGFVATGGVSLRLALGWSTEANYDLLGISYTSPSGSIRGTVIRIPSASPLSGLKVLAAFAARSEVLAAPRPVAGRPGSFEAEFREEGGLVRSFLAIESGPGLIVAETVMGASAPPEEAATARAIAASAAPAGGRISARSRPGAPSFATAETWSWIKDLDTGYRLVASLGIGKAIVDLAAADPVEIFPSPDSFGICAGTRSGSARGNAFRLGEAIRYEFETDLELAIVVMVEYADPLAILEPEALMALPEFRMLLEDCLSL